MSESYDIKDINNVKNNKTSSSGSYKNGTVATEELELDEGFDENFCVVDRWGEGELSSLWAISNHYGVSIEEIKKLNPEIGDDNVIHPQQIIKIPKNIEVLNEKIVDKSKKSIVEESIDYSNKDNTTKNDSVVTEENIKIEIINDSNSSKYTNNYHNNEGVSKYSSNPVNGDFEVTTGNRTYNLTEEERIKAAAIIYAEAAPGTDASVYNDMLAVGTSIANRNEFGRADTGAKFGGYDKGFVAVVSAPGQFSTYEGKSYNTFLTNYYNDNVDTRMEMCLNVVDDIAKGTRNHDYLSFRSSGSVNYSDNRIIDGGNRYAVKCDRS